MVGLCLVLASPVVFLLSMTFAGAWWDGPEVDVPRDGGTHEVRLDRPEGDYAFWTHPYDVEPTCVVTDQSGTDVVITPVPHGDRIPVEMLGAGPPEASALFTAPADGVVVMTCDDLRSVPASTLGLGAVPHHVGFEVVNWATLLSGPFVLLTGVVALSVTAWRHRSRPLSR